MTVATTQTSLQDLFASVREPLEAVRASLLEVIPPQSEVLAGTIQQSLTSGGKYLRPAVTLLASAAAGNGKGEIDQRHVEVAAVAEMIHIATLLHDDVLDEADLRRGKPTIRAALGNKISVLSGDFLLAQASLKLSKLGNTRLVAIYAQVLADLCDGEVIQMTTSYSLETSWEYYYRKTYCKTASLFSAGCESAGVVNDLPEAQVERLKDFGKYFGIAFQIVDDLLDYTASEAEMGKPVMDDLRNGLINAPVFLALETEGADETAREAFRASVRRIFEENAPAEDLALVREFLIETDAIERTRQLADDYIHRAVSALDFLAETPEKEALLSLARFVTRRRS